MNLKTPSQVATELGIDTSRVTFLIRKGRLKAEKFGSAAWMIRDEDIDAIRVRNDKRGPKGPRKKSIA